MSILRLHLRAHFLAPAAVIASLLASPALAQTAPRANLPVNANATHTTHAIPVPSAVALLKSGQIVVDGKLDDAAWKSATPITDFKQFDPDHDAPATEKIDVRFLYDESALYVAAKLSDRLGPSGVTSTVVRRDAFFNSDYFEIVIDGFHDHLGRAFFQVNPSGSKTDLIGIGNSCCDDGWDPVWEAQTSIDSEGWNVEIRIPFSQLRFSRDSVQTWGLQVRRYIKRRNETDQWSMWGRSESGGPNRFGHLEGIRIAHNPRNLEVLPYAMTKSANVQATPGDPFHDGSHQSLRAGVDLKYLLTPNLTLDATFNPDFGQVEVDPAVVNLSAFETFFSEKRPFFVSGAGIFNYGSFNCYFCSNVSSLQAFYSRRIGRAPTGADLAFAQGPYADVPEASSILGAAKITGRTSKGYTVGLLNAVTGRAMADVQLADGSRTTQEVEPLADYFVGRLKKDYKRGDLVIGAIGTSVVRDLPAEFEPRLSKHAELLGTDWRYTWKSRAYSFMGNVAVSNVEGDSRAILNKELSSARFYQRPDRQPGSSGFFATALDSTATSMRGYGGYARLAKEAGNWLWETGVNFRNPGFETNDYSFLTSADYIWNNANLAYQWTTPGRWYRNVIVIGGTQVQRNFDGDITSNYDQHLYVGTQTPQFWNVNGFYIHRPDNLIDDRLLRGGPSVRVAGNDFFSSNISTDQRKQWQLGSNPSYNRSTNGGWGQNLNLNASFQPSTRMYVSFGPSFSSSRGKLQYVRGVADPTAADFDGKRYVLADIFQKQVGLDTRFNVTFSPTMTLQIYAQPFLASGHYTAFKQFNAPRRAAYSEFGKDVGTIAPVTDAKGRVTSYTIDPDGTGPASTFSLSNPDFNFRSLRGSAVFRWEYRPGSTLYFVWTQQRSATAPIGDFDFARDRSALFDTKPDNIFLIKASWWMAK
ncbi:MAG TPA: DUF5916 domain-containing protein [Gemmatimonadaceae bacterium]|nr:DUF5916 domain-containing protein [Gemmatimonadaceae bacterium]